MKRLLIASIASLFLIGCSNNKYQVVIDSNPTGGKVFCNGQSLGFAPVTLNRTLTKEEKKNGSFELYCAIKWTSGAIERTPSIVDIKRFPKGAQATIQRPDYPNKEIDIQFAIFATQQRMYQLQQYEAQYYQMMNSFNQNNQTKTYQNSYSPDYFNTTIVQPQFQPNYPSNNINNGVPIYNSDECKGSIVNNKCMGTIIPNQVPELRQKCYGPVILGECKGRVGY